MGAFLGAGTVLILFGIENWRNDGIYLLLFGVGTIVAGLIVTIRKRNLTKGRPDSPAPNAYSDDCKLNGDDQVEETSSNAEVASGVKWYFRYPIAVLILNQANTMVLAKDAHWGIPLSLAIFAVALMHEAFLFVAILLGIAVLIQGIASLPVSIAIVIGALIIANARER